MAKQTVAKNSEPRKIEDFKDVDEDFKKNKWNRGGLHVARLRKDAEKVSTVAGFGGRTGAVSETNEQVRQKD